MSPRHSKAGIALLALALLAGAPAVQGARGESQQTGATANETPGQLKEVRFDQKLDAQVPLELAFTNEAGEQVTLSRYFGDKPVVLALGYFRCPMLCSMVFNGLTASLKVLPFNVGREFQVLTVSIDAREKPPLATEKKAGYLKSYNRPGAAEGWHFLTGSEANIRMLARSVGYHYTYDPKTDQFAHASGIVVLTPQGRVSRYFYGIEYSGRDLKMGLVDASAGKIGSKVEQVLMYCFHYDPATGKYSLSIMRTLRLFGMLTLAGIVGFILIATTRERRRRRARAGWGLEGRAA